MTTRPKLSWSDLDGTRVGVWGLGVEGSATVRRLVAMGLDPVLVDDSPPPEGGPDGRRVLAVAEGGLEALRDCEVVVKSPGVSRRRPDVEELVNTGVAVVGGLGLWMEETDRDRVVCITGTKGKSTTASVAGHLLTGLGYRCLVAGNIGLPPYDPDAPHDVDFWVVEVSSFQATDLASAPPVVAVTSLGADHLDWHGDTEAYVTDKLSLCTLPRGRLTVADGDSPLLRERRDQLGPDVRWVTAHDPALDGPWVDGLSLLGDHNRRNALIARACLAALGVAAAAEEPDGDPGALAAAAIGYPGLESRLRPVAEIDGVAFVDDSLSTNVLPTLAALDAFADRRVALLVGGFDRGIDYRPLAEALARRSAPTKVFTLPDNGPRIRQDLDAVLGDGQASQTVDVADGVDLDSATAAGFKWAEPDGVVLLSPAAPSFGRFRDYRHRAEAFAAAVAALAAH